MLRSVVCGLRKYACLKKICTRPVQKALLGFVTRCGDTTCTFPGGLIESFNASFEGQKHELLEMRKELDEEHERKKTELEAIQLDIKNQQEHLEATMRKLMEQLPRKD
ncbi:hypothetical protein R6Q59_006078 [Mikania micrantha]